MERRWVTEYVGIDGNRYAGPVIVADCRDAALAYLSVLEGPECQSLRLSGQLIAMDIKDDDTVETRVRCAS